MMKHVLAAGALMAGMAVAGVSSQAAPLSALQGAKSTTSGVTLVARGHGHGGFGKGGFGKSYGSFGKSYGSFGKGYGSFGKGGLRHHHHRRHGRVYGGWGWWGPGIGIGLYDGYYGYGYGYGGCGWLYRKAVRTGSRYWWRRYQDCRYGW